MNNKNDINMLGSTKAEAPNTMKFCEHNTIVNQNTLIPYSTQGTEDETTIQIDENETLHYKNLSKYLKNGLAKTSTISPTQKRLLKSKGISMMESIHALNKRISRHILINIKFNESYGVNRHIVKDNILGLLTRSPMVYCYMSDMGSDGTVDKIILLLECYVFIEMFSQKQKGWALFKRKIMESITTIVDIIDKKHDTNKLSVPQIILILAIMTANSIKWHHDIATEYNNNVVTSILCEGYTIPKLLSDILINSSEPNIYEGMVARNFTVDDINVKINVNNKDKVVTELLANISSDFGFYHIVEINEEYAFKTQGLLVEVDNIKEVTIEIEDNKGIYSKCTTYTICLYVLLFMMSVGNLIVNRICDNCYAQNNTDPTSAAQLGIVLWVGLLAILPIILGNNFTYLDLIRGKTLISDYQHMTKEIKKTLREIHVIQMMINDKLRNTISPDGMCFAINFLKGSMIIQPEMTLTELTKLGYTFWKSDDTNILEVMVPGMIGYKSAFQSHWLHGLIQNSTAVHLVPGVNNKKTDRSRPVLSDDRLIIAGKYRTALGIHINREADTDKMADRTIFANFGINKEQVTSQAIPRV